MYKAYNLADVDFVLGKQKQSYVSSGESKVVKGYKNIFTKKIESFKDSETGGLNAAKLTDDWFPQIDADVFISHSHNDYQDVVALAGWLHEKFGITAFIDECLWGFCEDLLRLIDNEYCITPDGKYYDYQKRNFSTSHVYMMLTTSLFEMIYKTECLFFYNTSESIVPKDIFSSTEQTLSPWIFSEIEMTKLIKTRKPDEHRQMRKSIMESSERPFSREDMKIEYDVDLSHLITLDNSFMHNWAKQKFNGDKDAALDYLYKYSDTTNFLRN
jgi:hypothetical protein